MTARSPQQRVPTWFWSLLGLYAAVMVNGFVPLIRLTNDTMNELVVFTAQFLPLAVASHVIVAWEGRRRLMWLIALLPMACFAALAALGTALAMASPFQIEVEEVQTIRLGT